MSLKDRLVGRGSTSSHTSGSALSPAAEARPQDTYQELKQHIHRQLIDRLDLASLESVDTDFLQAQVASGISMMEQFASAGEAGPAMKKVVAVLKAIHIAAEGKKGIARLEMEPLKWEDIPALMGGMFLREVPAER